MAFDDAGHGVLAQAHFAPDQPVAASLCHERHHLRGEPVRFRPVAWLAAEALAACLCRGDAGADALLDHLAFELSDTGQNRGYGTFQLDMAARLPLDPPISAGVAGQLPLHGV